MLRVWWVKVVSQFGVGCHSWLIVRLEANCFAWAPVGVGCQAGTTKRVPLAVEHHTKPLKTPSHLAHALLTAKGN